MADISEPGETAIGAIDGVNTTYATLNPYESGNLGVLYNGIELDPDTITELNSTTYRLSFAPTLGDRVQSFYVEATP